MMVAQKKANELNLHLDIPPYIGWNGDVSPCCAPGPPVMGNVKEKPFREIWNNELYQEMRRRLYTDNPFYRCKHCYLIVPCDDAASRLF